MIASIATLIPRHVLGVSMWIWIAILVTVVLVAFVVVSPASRDQGAGEPT